MLPVTRTNRATAGVWEMALFLCDQGAAGASARFSDAVDSTIEFIARFPDLGEVVSPLDLPKMLIRAVAVQGFPNYLIYFRRAADRVVIVRVVHGSRQIDIFPESS